jgi:flagellar basal-body rod protein FlgB
MTSLIGDTTMSALHHALTGLSLRQRTIANNISNIETPGFIAGKVDFETSLKRAVREQERPECRPRSVRARSLEPTRTNGSNVNLDEETLASAQTLLTTQLATADDDDASSSACAMAITARPDRATRTSRTARNAGRHAR